MESNRSSRAADSLAVASLLCTGAVIGWPVIAGGYLTYLDNPAHLAEVYAAAFEARNGWSEVAFCGFPIATLHSPLWYGLLSWLARIGFGSTPYVCCVWIGLVAPSLALYRVARRSLAPLPAGAVAYLLLVQRPSVVGVGSAAGGMWTFYIAAAALILLVDRVSRPCTSRRDAAEIAALVGLILVTHLYAVVPLALLAAVHAWVVVGSRRGRRAGILRQASAAALGAAAAAAYWAPMVLARGALVIHPQNLDARSIIARLLVPTHVFELLNRHSTPIDAAAAVAALPMVALAAAGVLGVFHLNRRSNDAPLYGAVIAAVLLTVLLFLTSEFEIRLLGPGSWRLLYFVRVGLALAAVPFLVRLTRLCGRRARGTVGWWAGPLLVAVALAVGWWFGAPLRAVVPPAGGTEMADVEALWAWLRAHRTGEWGRVYLQDTFEFPKGDVKLSQSHVLALTSDRTGVYQLGATYGVAPYRTVSWTPSEFGTLFRRFVTDDEEVYETRVMLWAVNGTHVVTSYASTERMLESSDDFEVVHRVGRYTVFRAKTVSNEWASAMDPGLEVAVDAFETGRYRMRVFVQRPGGQVLVKSSYHPAWRLTASGAGTPKLRQEDSGLMRLEGWAVGETSVELDYHPVRWPVAVSLCAWAAIAGLFVIRRRWAP
jgi:hypothetical protein